MANLSLTTTENQQSYIQINLGTACMVQEVSGSVSLGFYPEKSEPHDSSLRQLSSLSVQKVSVPDKKGPFSSLR